MNLVAQYLCVYLISCVDEGPQLANCPEHCTCYNAPPPISFDDDDDDDEFDDKKSKLNFLKFIV